MARREHPAGRNIRPRLKRIVAADKFLSRADTEKYAIRLGEQLRLYREKHSYTLEAIGDYLGCSKSNVSLWETGQRIPLLEYLLNLSRLYACSLVDLIGEDVDIQPSRKSVEYFLRLPRSALLDEVGREEIQRGVTALTALFEGKTLEELLDLPDFAAYRGNQDGLFALLRTSLLSGEIAFTQVPFAAVLEEKLTEKFPQLQGAVRVVDLPDTMISEALPPELVAWAAAQQAITELRQPTRVGLGYGYTLHRMCLTIPPTTHQFNGTQWIPLISYAGKESATIHAANYLAALMAHRHFKSTAVYLPYVPPHGRASHRGLEAIRRDWELLNVSFVGGFPWSRASNFRVARSLRTIYRELESSGQIDTIAGEFLGYILDVEGNVVKEQETAQATTRISLEDVKQTVARGRVYFVGGLREKAPIVRAAINKGYVNGLVTDSHLAKALLE